jgi:hypothetical protein
MRHTGSTTDTRTLDNLLQAERSAVDTYRQLIEKFSQEPGIDQIYAVQRDHRVAVSRLCRHIEEHGGKPSEASSPWGSLTRALARSSKLFGDAAALKALKEGEERALNEFKEAMEGGTLAEDCIELIRPLLVQDRQHVALINRLMDRIC